MSERDVQEAFIAGLLKAIRGAPDENLKTWEQHLTRLIADRKCGLPVNEQPNLLVREVSTRSRNTWAHAAADHIVPRALVQSNFSRIFVSFRANEALAKVPPNPPAFAEFLLSSVAGKRRDRIVGDSLERFRRDCEQRGARRARLLYWSGVVATLWPTLWAAVKRAGVVGIVAAAARKLFS